MAHETYGNASDQWSETAPSNDIPGRPAALRSKVTVAVQPWVPGGDPATKLAYTAAAVAFAAYLVGFGLSFWLPEPESEDYLRE